MSKTADRAATPEPAAPDPTEYEVQHSGVNHGLRQWLQGEHVTDADVPAETLAHWQQAGAVRALTPDPAVQEAQDAKALVDLRPGTIPAAARAAAEATVADAEAADLLPRSEPVADAPAPLPETAPDAAEPGKGAADGE
jgi:predicted transcriptional regulator